MMTNDKSMHCNDSITPPKSAKLTLSKSHVFGKTMFKQFIRMYLALIALFFIYTKVAEPLFYDLYHQEIYQDHIHDYETIVILLNKLYPTQTSEQWQKLLQDINATSNIPVKTMPLEQLNLPEKYLRQINLGLPVMPFYPADVHFQLIAPNVVTQIGPMGDNESVAVIYLLLKLLPVILFGGFSLLWVVSLQYRLVRLENSVNSFSQGKFNVRAPSGILALGNLNLVFNQMAERLNQLFKSKKHLINAVSHELRSPISRLRFQLEMMGDTSDDNQRNLYLSGMNDDIDDMDKMVHELLSYTKLEEAEPLLQLEIIDISSWLYKQQQYLFPEINTEMTVDTPAQGSLVTMEPQLMSRLLRNLVSNADKYTQTTIVIGASVDALQYKLWVDDDGPGIPKGKDKYLFEAFTRLDTSRNKNTGGYGLGLAIVAQIARQHYGSVNISRSEYGGTRMLVTWPVKQPHE